MRRARWKDYGEHSQLVDHDGCTRAFVWAEWDGYQCARRYFAVGIFGAAPLVERNSKNERNLRREMRRLYLEAFPK